MTPAWQRPAHRHDEILATGMVGGMVGGMEISYTRLEDVVLQRA